MWQPLRGYPMQNDNCTQKFLDVEELRRWLLVLKNNRDHIPISVLKSKYKNAYNNLCDKIRTAASVYVKEVSLHSLQVHIAYAEDISSIVTEAINNSGILHELSEAIYQNQDLNQFIKLTEDLRKVVLLSLSDYLDAKIVIDTSHKSNAT